MVGLLKSFGTRLRLMMATATRAECLQPQFTEMQHCRVLEFSVSPTRRRAAVICGCGRRAGWRMASCTLHIKSSG